MKEINLKDYLIDGIQQDVADSIGMTQGAINHMAHSTRDIRLVLNKNGKIVRAWEKKWLKK